MKKPVVATKDLRFFGFPDTESLPDGYPRRGMSVVAALSEWLIHTNRRLDGAWTQRYEHGVPVTGLEPLQADGTTGTLIRFLPDTALRAQSLPTADDLARWTSRWSGLQVRIDDQRDSGASPSTGRASE
ncbi:hypothetical protein [Streptomyces sp. NPDC001450]